MTIMDTVREIIRKSDNIVFFGGAGVSTASGIPDFRSQGGIYKQKVQGELPTEYYFSHEFSVTDPDGFADFCRQNHHMHEVAPNGAHYALFELEKQGKLKAIVTQNIDGLHQKAGSTNVYEIHGNMRDYACPRCGHVVSTEDFMAQKGAYPCPKCKTNVRASVVLYGESLPINDFDQSIAAIAKAKTLIVGGTSLVVYPAAGLVNFYKGNELILINRDPTPSDTRADYLLQGDISVILPELVHGKDVS